MAYTLLQARERVSIDFLDDTNNTQWPTTRLDRALRAELGKCVELYASKGGRRFNRRLEVSTVAGVADLTATALSSVRAVTQRQGAIETELRASSTYVRPLLAGAVDLAIYYTPVFTFPSGTSNPLVGDGATADPGGFEAFDDWICLRAAVNLRASRGESLPSSLVQLEREAAAVVLESNETPRSRRFNDVDQHSRVFEWTWDANARSLIVSYRGAGSSIRGRIR